MQVDLVFQAAEVTPSRVEGKTVVVIDVMRATSTIVAALEAGASSVYTAATPEQAQDLAAELEQDRSSPVFLAGERDGSQLEGFDSDNSPSRLTQMLPSDSILVLTTSNGTLAIEKSRPADALYLASFLNVAGVLERLTSQKRDVVLVCAGTQRGSLFCYEDGLLAGVIALALTNSLSDVSLSESARLASQAARAEIEGEARDLSSAQLHKILQFTRGARRLRENDLMEDLIFCCSLNQTSLVPRYTSEDRFVKS